MPHACPLGHYDAYLAVEYYDDHVGIANVEYDKVPYDRVKKNSPYTKAEDGIPRPAAINGNAR